MIGQVLDSSGLDAIVGNDLVAASWLITAYSDSSPLVLPVLALSEVQALRSELLTDLEELLDHPCVVRRELDGVTAAELDTLFRRTGTFDVCAGHVVAVARQRGWPAMTADPARLRRIDPDVAVLLV